MAILYQCIFPYVELPSPHQVLQFLWPLESNIEAQCPYPKSQKPWEDRDDVSQSNRGNLPPPPAFSIKGIALLGEELNYWLAL